MTWLSKFQKTKKEEDFKKKQKEFENFFNPIVVKHGLNLQEIHHEHSHDHHGHGHGHGHGHHGDKEGNGHGGHGGHGDHHGGHGDPHGHGNNHHKAGHQREEEVGQDAKRQRTV